MRPDRFVVLSFWPLLAALVAVSLGPGSTPVALASCNAPAEPCFAEAGDGIPTIDAVAVVATDAATKTGCKLCRPGASSFVAAPALWRPQCPPLGGHSDRSPPLA